MNTALPTKALLLIDDDRDDRELFGEAIASIGSSLLVHFAENGKEAFDTLAKSVELPQLIFLDINMPVMDGWQFLKEIKLNERYSNIPIAMYSTSSLQRDINKAYEMGAAFFIVKPSDYTELKGLLANVIAGLDN